MDFGPRSRPRQPDPPWRVGSAKGPATRELNIEQKQKARERREACSGSWEVKERLEGPTSHLQGRHRSSPVTGGRGTGGPFVPPRRGRSWSAVLNHGRMPPLDAPVGSTWPTYILFHCLLFIGLTRPPVQPRRLREAPALTHGGKVAAEGAPVSALWPLQGRFRLPPKETRSSCVQAARVHHPHLERLLVFSKSIKEPNN